MHAFFLLDIFCKQRYYFYRKTAKEKGGAKKCSEKICGKNTQKFSRKN